MTDVRLHQLVETLLDFVRRPVTPFDNLCSIGDSFVVVDGDLSLVRAAGRAYSLSHRGRGRNFEYLVCPTGVVVVLTESDDPQYESLVHLDPERGFLSVDRVRVVSGKPQGVCLVDPGDDLGEVLAELSALPDEVSVDFLCRKTRDVVGFFGLAGDSEAVDLPF